MCDFLRQMTKIHTSPNISGITKREKCVAKATSYFLTDGETPVIGEWCKAVLSHCDIVNPRLNKRFRWNLQWDKADQCINEFEEWMYEPIVESGFDMKRFYDWLTTCKSLDDLMSPPICLKLDPPEPEDNVVINNFDTMKPIAASDTLHPSCPRKIAPGPGDPSYEEQRKQVRPRRANFRKSKSKSKRKGNYNKDGYK